MLSPPVPFSRVKSPCEKDTQNENSQLSYGHYGYHGQRPDIWSDLTPWHMKPGITRWNGDPLKWRGFPKLPMPFSPVHRQRKFWFMSEEQRQNKNLSCQLQFFSLTSAVMGCGTLVWQDGCGKTCELAAIKFFKANDSFPTSCCGGTNLKTQSHADNYTGRFVRRDKRTTTSARSSISIRPFGEPPMEISKKTTGFSLMLQCLQCVV